MQKIAFWSKNRIFSDVIPKKKDIIKIGELNIHRERENNMITKKYKIDEENDLFDEISEKRRQFYQVLEETDISIEHMEKLIGSFEDVFSEAAYHTMMEHKLTMEIYKRFGYTNGMETVMSAVRSLPAIQETPELDFLTAEELDQITNEEKQNIVDITLYRKLRQK